MSRLDDLIKEELEKFQKDSEKILQGSRELTEKIQAKNQYKELVKLNKAKLQDLLKSKYKITKLPDDLTQDELASMVLDAQYGVGRWTEAVKQNFETDSEEDFYNHHKVSMAAKMGSPAETDTVDFDDGNEKEGGTQYKKNKIKRGYEPVKENKRIKEDLPTKEIEPKEFPNPYPDKKGFFKKGREDGEVKDDIVPTKPVSISVSQLKPSQDAIYLGKAIAMAINGVEGGDLGAVISQDNYILDGHHRYAATSFNNPSAKVGGVQAKLKIGDLIPVLRAAGDAMRNARGVEPKGGDINIFNATIDDVKDIVYKGKNVPAQYYNKEKAISWFEGHGEDVIAQRLKQLQSKKPPSGAPARKDMPKIKPDQVGIIKALLNKGKIDVREPYAEAKMPGYNLDIDTKKNWEYEKIIGQAISKLPGIDDYTKAQQKGGRWAVQDMAYGMVIKQYGKDDNTSKLKSILSKIDPNIDVSTLKNNFKSGPSSRSKHEQDNDIWTYEVRKKKDYHQFKKGMKSKGEPDTKMSRDVVIDLLDMMAPYSTTQDQLANQEWPTLKSFLQAAADHIDKNNFKKFVANVMKKYPNIKESVKIPTFEELTVLPEDMDCFLEGLRERQNQITEAEYQGREVELNKPMRGDTAKYKVYVKNDKGNVVKVNFGAKGMEIKRDNAKNKKSFRARHNCADKKDKTSAGYWSCKMWGNKKVSDILKGESVNEGHYFTGKMLKDLSLGGKMSGKFDTPKKSDMPKVTFKKGEKVELEIQPNSYHFYGKDGKHGYIDKDKFRDIDKYVFYESINEGWPNEYKGNDGIIWKKKWERGGKANYEPFYKGHNIDTGGATFGSDKEAKSFIGDYIVSNQIYNKYRNESVNEAEGDISTFEYIAANGNTQDKFIQALKIIDDRIETFGNRRVLGDKNKKAILVKIPRGMEQKVSLLAKKMRLKPSLDNESVNESGLGLKTALEDELVKYQKLLKKALRYKHLPKYQENIEFLRDKIKDIKSMIKTGNFNESVNEGKKITHLKVGMKVKFKNHRGHDSEGVITHKYPDGSLDIRDKKDFIAKFKPDAVTMKLGMVESVNEAAIWAGPFLITGKESAEELQAKYDSALNAYSRWNKGMEHSKGEYKKAYTTIEKIAKKLGIQLESINEVRGFTQDELRKKAFAFLKSLGVSVPSETQINVFIEKLKELIRIYKLGKVFESVNEAYSIDTVKAVRKAMTDKWISDIEKTAKIKISYDDFEKLDSILSDFIADIKRRKNESVNESGIGDPPSSFRVDRKLNFGKGKLFPGLYKLKKLKKGEALYYNPAFKAEAVLDELDLINLDRIQQITTHYGPVKEDMDIGHQDDEPNMLKDTAYEIKEYGEKLMNQLAKYDEMEEEVDFPNWWQAKLILSKEYLQKAYHYLDSKEETDDIEELDEKKKGPGLWDNIHAKRKRGEAPNKPGQKGYPSKKAWKSAKSESIDEATNLKAELDKWEGRLYTAQNMNSPSNSSDSKKQENKIKAIQKKIDSIKKKLGESVDGANPLVEPDGTIKGGPKKKKVDGECKDHEAYPYEVDKLDERKLPNNKWVELKGDDFKEFADEIYDMIKKTYAGIGGHPNFKSPSDINPSDANYWEAVDVDGDGDPDAVSAAKKKPAGIKYVAGANDGSKEAKRAYIGSRVKNLKKSGHYVEASHKLADILASNGVPIVKDPEVIQRVMKGKKLNILDDGWFEREIGGKMFKKRLFGKPRA